MSEPTPLDLWTRLWFAWVCFFRVLFDAPFAARAFAVRRAPPALPGGEPTAPALPATTGAVAAPVREPPPRAPRPSHEAALQLLGLLQREGRLLDFLFGEDLAAHPDAAVGAAARVVHAGCAKALRGAARFEPVRPEDEGAAVTVAEADLAAVQLVGQVRGRAPFRGVLRHRGWRVRELSLPEALGDVDLHVVAPAEVELG